MAKAKSSIMPEPTSITVKNIRTSLGEVINRVHYNHQPYIITRQNKPMAVMLNMEDYEDLLDMLDTMAEQLDPEFQKSLLAARKDIEEGQGGTLEDIKQILESKLAYAR